MQVLGVRFWWTLGALISWRTHCRSEFNRICHKFWKVPIVNELKCLLKWNQYGRLIMLIAALKLSEYYLLGTSSSTLHCGAGSSKGGLSILKKSLNLNWSFKAFWIMSTQCRWGSWRVQRSIGVGTCWDYFPKWSGLNHCWNAFEGGHSALTS